MRASTALWGSRLGSETLGFQADVEGATGSSRGARASPRVDAPKAYRSSGLRPVFLAIRPSITGPISSLSWKAKT